MKRAMLLFALPVLALVVLSHAKNVEAAEMTNKEITNHLGRKVMVVGQTKAVARWTTTNGATAYNLYYKVCGEVKDVGGVVMSPSQTAYEVGYLDPNRNWCYRVAAMVNRKEMWQAEKRLFTAVVSQPVLGETTFNPYDNSYSNAVGGFGVDNQPYANVPKRTFNNFGNGLDQEDNPFQESNTYNTYAEDEVLGVMTGTQPSMTVNWTNPGGLKKVHVYFWSAKTDQHAARDLDRDKTQYTLNYLNTNRVYKYKVQGVKFDNTTVWLKGETRL